LTGYKNAAVSVDDHKLSARGKKSVSQVSKLQAISAWLQEWDNVNLPKTSIC